MFVAHSPTDSNNAGLIDRARRIAKKIVPTPFTAKPASALASTGEKTTSASDIQRSEQQAAALSSAEASALSALAARQSRALQVTPHTLLGFHMYNASCLQQISHMLPDIITRVQKGRPAFTRVAKLPTSQHRWGGMKESGDKYGVFDDRLAPKGAIAMMCVSCVCLSLLRGFSISVSKKNPNCMLSNPGHQRLVRYPHSKELR